MRLLVETPLIFGMSGQLTESAILMFVPLTLLFCLLSKGLQRRPHCTVLSSVLVEAVVMTSPYVDSEVTFFHMEIAGCF